MSGDKKVSYFFLNDFIIVMFFYSQNYFWVNLLWCYGSIVWTMTSKVRLHCVYWWTCISNINIFPRNRVLKGTQVWKSSSFRLQCSIAESWKNLKLMSNGAFLLNLNCFGSATPTSAPATPSPWCRDGHCSRSNQHPWSSGPAGFASLYPATPLASLGVGRRSPPPWRYGSYWPCHSATACLGTFQWTSPALDTVMTDPSEYYLDPNDPLNDTDRSGNHYTNGESSLPRNINGMVGSTSIAQRNPTADRCVAPCLAASSCQAPSPSMAMMTWKNSRTWRWILDLRDHQPFQRQAHLLLLLPRSGGSLGALC